MDGTTTSVTASVPSHRGGNRNAHLGSLQPHHTTGNMPPDVPRGARPRALGGRIVCAVALLVVANNAGFAAAETKLSVRKVPPHAHTPSFRRTACVCAGVSLHRLSNQKARPFHKDRLPLAHSAPSRARAHTC